LVLDGVPLGKPVGAGSLILPTPVGRLSLNV
jgi:hypothetical protein